MQPTTSCESRQEHVLRAGTHGPARGDRAVRPRRESRTAHPGAPAPRGGPPSIEATAALVRHERRHVPDDGRMWAARTLVEVHGLIAATCSTSMPSWTVTVRSGRNAVRDEHLPDHLGGGDEAVDPPVLPARQRVALEVKVDAREAIRPAPAHRPRTTARAPPSRSRADRGRARRPAAAFTTRARRHAADRSTSDLGAIGISSSPRWRAAAVRRQGARRARPMADLAKAVHGQEHLVLPTTPRAGGVDVKRTSQGAGAALGARLDSGRVLLGAGCRVLGGACREAGGCSRGAGGCWSCHSFENFRNTCDAFSVEMISPGTPSRKPPRR